MAATFPNRTQRKLHHLIPIKLYIQKKKVCLFWPRTNNLNRTNIRNITIIDGKRLVKIIAMYKYCNILWFFPSTRL